MPIPSPEQYRQTYVQQIQPYLTEPILAVGFISTAGYASGLVADAVLGKAISSLSFVGGRMFHRNRREVRDTVVKNQLVAITATTVNMFDFLAGQDFAVRNAPTVWLRSSFRVTAEERGRLTQHLHVDFATGERIDVDVNFSKGPWATFNDPMLALLMQSPTV
ncbi:MAG: hypothetical protein JWN62_1604 [Acidimicrobiales bacterium]|nr:hypothetical protein [Acidimicrobiales bacterium]